MGGPRGTNVGSSSQSSPAHGPIDATVDYNSHLSSFAEALRDVGTQSHSNAGTQTPKDKLEGQCPICRVSIGKDESLYLAKLGLPHWRKVFLGEQSGEKTTTDTVEAASTALQSAPEEKRAGRRWAQRQRASMQQHPLPPGAFSTLY